MAKSGSRFPWARLITVLLCVVACLLWICVQLLLHPSIPHLTSAEHEEFRRREAELHSRIATLEQQLADQRAASQSDAQAAVIKSLRDEVSSLKQQRGDTATWQSPSAAPALRVYPSNLVAPNTAPLTEQRLRDLAAQGAVGVVVIVCKRPKYLLRTMTSILGRARNPEHFPIVISQDGFDETMTAMVEQNYHKAGIAFHMHHTHEPNAASVAKRFGGTDRAIGYVRIAQHYGYALRRMFDEFGFEQIIFLEEDMEVAPDFFSYFDAMLQILRSDAKLYCVSAWNDNGHRELAQDSRAVYRTEVFPGLGWMLQRSFWEEVKGRWPQAYWDEFMRRPDVRKQRTCLRPEVSRTYTFGEEGTSGGQFFGEHLSRIRLNDVMVNWGVEDLRHLASEPAFEEHLRARLQAATRTSLNELLQLHDGGIMADLRLEYDNARDYHIVAQNLGLMTDEKEGLRRSSYRGVIPLSWRGSRLLLHTARWPGDLH